MGAMLTVDPMTFRNPVQVEIRYSGPAGYGNNFDVVTDEIHNRVKADAIKYGAMKDFQLVFYDYPLKGYHESFELFINGESVYVGVPDTDGPEMSMIIERIYKEGLGDSAPEEALQPYFKSGSSRENREVEPQESRGLPDTKKSRNTSSLKARMGKSNRSKMEERIAELEAKLAQKETEQEELEKQEDKSMENKIQELEGKLIEKEAKNRKSAKENDEIMAAFQAKKVKRISLKKRLEDQLAAEDKLEACFEGIEGLEDALVA
jgi:hypothetical protein